MSKKALKSWMKAIGVIITLLLIAMFFFEYLGTSDYIQVYFINPFLVYIPLAIVAVSAVFYIIYLFAEDGKDFKRLSVIGLCVVASYVFIFVSVMMYSQNKPQNIAKYNNAQEAFSVSDLTESKPEDIFEVKYALGNSLLYEIEASYENGDSYICVEGLYFEKYPFLGKKKFFNDAKDRYFFNKWTGQDIDEENIEYKTYGDVTCRYACPKDVSDYGVRRHDTYFVVMLEDEDSIIIKSIKVGSKDEFEIDAEKTVEEFVQKVNITA